MDDLDLQQAQLQQRQKMAQMLMQQGLQPAQGQMMGRVFVGNPQGAIGNMAQALMGSKMNDDANQSMQGISDQRRQRTADILRQGFDALKSGDQQGAAQIFAGSDQTSPYAQELVKGQMQQLANQAKTEYKAPTQRSFRETDEKGNTYDVSQEFDPASHQWNNVGRALAWQPGGNTNDTKNDWQIRSDANGNLVRVNARTGEGMPNPSAPGNDAHSFTSGASDLLASLAAKGLSLPTGMRSKDQQIATLNGLTKKFPDLSPDQIAEKIASGQIDFGAAKKETTTAAAQAGRVSIATNELNTFAPVVLQASAAVPRGQFMPINKLMQTADTQLSDPKLVQLKIGITSMLNAYDQLAARGGTDAKKREEAHNLIQSAQSPEALEAGIQMFQREAAAAGEAADKATKYKGGTSEAPAQKRLKFNPATGELE